VTESVYDNDRVDPGWINSSRENLGTKACAQTKGSILAVHSYDEESYIRELAPKERVPFGGSSFHCCLG